MKPYKYILIEVVFTNEYQRNVSKNRTSPDYTFSDKMEIQEIPNCLSRAASFQATTLNGYKQGRSRESETSCDEASAYYCDCNLSFLVKCTD